MADASQKVPVKSAGKPTPAPAARSWSPFESLRQEIDRLFDDFHPLGWRSAFGRTPGPDVPWPRLGALQIAPAIDLVEKGHEFEITCELPGMDEGDIELKLVGDMLTIKGEKTEQKEEREKDYHLSERRYGSFQRSFQLPDGVDAGKIEASFAKGVLTVKLPKSTEAQKKEKKIEVKPA